MGVYEMYMSYDTVRCWLVTARLQYDLRRNTHWTLHLYILCPIFDGENPTRILLSCNIFVWIAQI